METPEARAPEFPEYTPLYDSPFTIHHAGMAMKRNDYLERILAARVYDVALKTPLELAGHLSARLDNRLCLKREDLQPVFSFKLRSDYNKMVRLQEATITRYVIAE